VAHIIEESLKNGKTFEAAMLDVAKEIKGSYAIAAIFCSDPNEIICLRKESPLVIGIGEDGVYCASDVPAFLSLTRKALYIEENEMVVLTLEGVRIYNATTGQQISRAPVEITWSPDSARKEGFPHYMLKEIHEQGTTIRNALRTQTIYHELVASKILEADRVFFIACGTAFHSCLAGSRAFAKLAHVDAHAVVGSEFNGIYADLLTKRSVIIAVSQSGETADTLSAVREAKSRGASILSITNVMGSTLTRLSDVYIGQNSGPEIGVAATKTFTAQVAILTKLAVILSARKGTISSAIASELMKKLEESAFIADKILIGDDEKIRSMSRRYKDRVSFCFLGRGISEVTALEARLKLLEIAYVPALAYAAGESKHGFIALVEPGYPVVFITPQDDTYNKIIGNVMEMKARGAHIIAVVDANDSQIKKLADDYIEIPAGTVEITTPLTYVIPLQLFAYHMAVERGYDPDQPRNLAKSVTVQ
ncbi:MAG: glutamine--fructose-6-phosphate transaminase (isomerizing), partial [archaeon]